MTIDDCATNVLVLDRFGPDADNYCVQRISGRLRDGVDLDDLDTIVRDETDHLIGLDSGTAPSSRFRSEVRIRAASAVRHMLLLHDRTMADSADAADIAKVIVDEAALGLNVFDG